MQAYKGRDEEYKLFWPQQSEFVRMAAKFGATIVPFAAIGLDDSFNMVLDASDIRNIPVVGDAIASRAAKLPQARRCGAETYLICEIVVIFFCGEEYRKTSHIHAANPSIFVHLSRS